MPKKTSPQMEQISLEKNCVKNYSLEESRISDLHIFKPETSNNPTYIRKNGMLFTGNSLQWLKSLQDESIDMIFADPPYNIKKADWDKFDSQEEYIKWSLQWISEASRILKPTGSLYICGFSEILADLKHPAMRYFSGCKWLIWHYRNKAHLNVDEIRIPYGSHTLKYPTHPQSESSQYSNGKKTNPVWTPNPLGAKPKDVFEVPTTCNGMGEKTKHPTQKPEELLRKLVLASSKVGDVILDPFSGSGTTLVVAEQLQRLWIGCEMNEEYNSWAINRIDHVCQQPIEKWIMYDKENVKRRESIR